MREHRSWTGEPGTGRLAVAQALQQWQEVCVIDGLLVVRADIRRIGVEHLPPEYRARGARRPLASLEQTEAHAILSALRAVGGNKNQAAQSLGIARSTLYRKVRALGLDLSSTVY